MTIKLFLGEVPTEIGLTKDANVDYYYFLSIKSHKNNETISAAASNNYFIIS